jgi:hypothetical protein
MFRDLCFAMRSFGDTISPAREAAAPPVDSYFRAHRMVCACRPEKAARFVFATGAVNLKFSLPPS